MAPAKKSSGKKAAAPSFDSIIEAERLTRKKKENQILADQLLGSKKRRASAPGPGAVNKKTTNNNSLGSRIGVVKRSASTSSKSKTPTAINTSRNAARQNTQAKQTPSRRSREDRMLDDINGRKKVVDILQPRKTTEITIKGTAATGPFVVVARNFAPGTNAADIEAAMEPVAGHIQGVHITSYTPYVNAQIACAERWGAEAIVAQFNGQKADGRILSLEYKGSGSLLFGPSAAGNGNQATLNAYDALRQQADRERREKKKIAEPQIQDGRYGFGNSSRDRPARPDQMFIDMPMGQEVQSGRKYR